MNSIAQLRTSSEDPFPETKSSLFILQQMYIADEKGSVKDPKKGGEEGTFIRIFLGEGVRWRGKKRRWKSEEEKKGKKEDRYLWLEERRKELRKWGLGKDKNHQWLLLLSASFQSFTCTCTSFYFLKR